MDARAGVSAATARGRRALVTYETALAVADLTQEEVDAIARHENLPDTAAMELGQYLCETPEGERALKQMIVDDLEERRAKGDHEGAARLRLVLKRFVETHPRAAATRGA